MAIQLTVKQPDTDEAHFSRPARLCEFTQLPLTLGGEGCALILPELQGEAALIAQDELGFFLQSLSEQYRIEAGQGQLAPHEKHRLHHGESFLLHNYEISFYRNFAKAKLSRQSGFLTAAAKCGIALILLMQLFAITLLPGLMKKESFWLGQQMHLDISARCNRLKKMLQKADSKDPVVQAMQQAFRQELQQRTKYLRRQSRHMSRSQRRKMQETLQNIENELAALQDVSVYGIYPEPDLQARLKTIIQAESQP